MNEKLLLIPILLPALASLGILFLPFRSRFLRCAFILFAASLNTAVILTLALNTPAETLVIFRMSQTLSFSLLLDRAGAAFSVLMACLWPLTTLYAFEYMGHEEQERPFFAWFTLTYGVTAGVAMAANLLTLYFFYELLTLTTLPLVMHSMDGKARYAGRQYLIYAVGGASCAFVAMAFTVVHGGYGDFAPGGILPMSLPVSRDMLCGFYMAGFLGFGVKAAIFPFHSWLPAAAVAPTPVTALLHAVAVVKSGVFAIIRLTWYVFGPNMLMGTWAHVTAFILACITVVYGSSMALASQHLKIRFAYSTISQLSYILMGVLLLSPAGLAAGLTFMVAHAVIKINLFFCAGAILHQTNREYLFDMRGIAFGMPWTFLSLLISGFALCGLPPSVGFIGKWHLGVAAAAEGHLGLLAIAALVVSAVLTVLYTLSIFGVAVMPGKNFDFESANRGVADPGAAMLISTGILAAAAILLGLYAEPFTSFFTRIGVIHLQSHIQGGVLP